MRVMVIDDEIAHMRGVINHIDWEKMDFDIPLGLTNPIEALKILKKEKFDVVITDIKMPELSGLELIKQLREAGKDMDIIIVTGYDEFQYAKEAIKLGVYAYLLKPLHTEELEENLIKIRKSRSGKAIRSIEGKEKSIHPSIIKIMHYVEDNYGKELTIKGLAEKFKMNSDYLSSLFKKETGINLNGYINEIRLKAALKIIRETDERISAVAYRVGYTNPNYFAEQFKNYYGCTPKEARNQ